ncbi:GNAT family N-acetyltransferase, partial [Sinorhizobium meliloti]
MVAIGEDGEANRLDHLRLRPGELEHLARLRAARASMERYLRTALFYALRDKAQEQGNIFSILSGTHLNNLAAQ